MKLIANIIIHCHDANPQPSATQLRPSEQLVSATSIIQHVEIARDLDVTEVTATDYYWLVVGAHLARLILLRVFSLMIFYRLCYCICLLLFHESRLHCYAVVLGNNRDRFLGQTMICRLQGGYI